MNRKRFEIGEKWKNEQLQFDIDHTADDLASRGMAQSGLRAKTALYLVEKCKAEIEMERATMVAEEKENEARQRERHDQSVANKLIALFGLVSICVSLWVAIFVPRYEKVLKREENIEAIYKNLVANQDIFVFNSNIDNDLADDPKITAIPDVFIEYDIDGDTRKIIQDKFGLVQYRYFLYYVQQTKLLNETINHMRAALFEDRNQFIVYKKNYFTIMDYLNAEQLNTKFNYINDAACLQYMFEQSFSPIKPDGRGEILDCSSDSLNRIHHYFGFLPADTPSWLIPKLRAALNERQSGLGDSIIGDQEGR